MHALSFILSEEWHIPPGVACAFTLEDVMRLNMQDENTRRKLLAVAHGVFGEGAEEPLLEGLFHRIVELKRKFRLPFTFADINVGLSAAELSPLFEKSLDDPKMSNNIVPVDMKIVKEIIAAKSL